MSSIYVLHCAFIRSYEADWQSFYRNWSERTGQMRHIHCKSAYLFEVAFCSSHTHHKHTHTSTHTNKVTHRHMLIKQKLAQCVQIFVVWLKATLECIMPSYIFIYIYTDICDIQIYVIDVYINVPYIYFIRLSASLSCLLCWHTWLDFLRSSDRKFSLSLSFISFLSFCYLSYTIYIV